MKCPDCQHEEGTIHTRDHCIRDLRTDLAAANKRIEDMAVLWTVASARANASDLTIKSLDRSLEGMTGARDIAQEKLDYATHKLAAAEAELAAKESSIANMVRQMHAGAEWIKDAPIEHNSLTVGGSAPYRAGACSAPDSEGKA